MSQFLGNPFKIISDKISSRLVRHRVLQAGPYWIASVITGLVAVFYAKLFALAETASITLFNKAEWSIFLISPICFFLSWWMVKKFAQNSKGSGVPQVMAAIELATPKYNKFIDSLLSLKIILIKIISSIVMVFGGGAIGREGPTIQIAGSIFWEVNRHLPKSWPKLSKKNMILTGAAAGLSAAFNTPLGGMVFAIEELARTHISSFKTEIFTAVIIAGLTALWITGPYLYLDYPDLNGMHTIIWVYVLMVAVLAGILGALMCKFIIILLEWKSRVFVGKKELVYVLAASLAIAALAYFFHSGVLGSGKEAMKNMLFTADKHSGWRLTVARIIGPALSFTTGAAGGVFAPSLSAGACFGSLVAQVFDLASGDANMLILCGMVAFLTGVTRSPFTSAILVMEMTGGHNDTFYLMLTGITAVMVAGLVEKCSFYQYLERNYLNALVVAPDLDQSVAATE